MFYYSIKNKKHFLQNLLLYNFFSLWYTNKNADNPRTELFEGNLVPK